MINWSVDKLIGTARLVKQAIDQTRATWTSSDTVNHVILLSKLAQLNLPAFVINWICSFLTGRSQQCKVNGALSDAINIGLSIVQGSGIGPILYIVMKSDLCARLQRLLTAAARVITGMQKFDYGLFHLL